LHKLPPEVINDLTIIGGVIQFYFGAQPTFFGFDTYKKMI